MDKVYAALIKKGIKTIGQVPMGIRKAVQALLDAEGENHGRN